MYTINNLFKFEGDVTVRAKAEAWALNGHAG